MTCVLCIGESAGSHRMMKVLLVYSFLLLVVGPGATKLLAPSSDALCY